MKTYSLPPLTVVPLAVPLSYWTAAAVDGRAGGRAARKDVLEAAGQDNRPAGAAIDVLIAAAVYGRAVGRAASLDDLGAIAVDNCAAGRAVVVLGAAIERRTAVCVAARNDLVHRRR